jgi:hypothetical protein
MNREMHQYSFVLIKHFNSSGILAGTLEGWVQHDRRG